MLINIDNLVKLHLGDFFQDDAVSCYADSPEEYISAISNFKKLDKQTVINCNRKNIVPGYHENMLQALKLIRVI